MHGMSIHFRVRRILEMGKFAFIPFPVKFQKELRVRPGEWREVVLFAFENPNKKAKGLLINFGQKTNHFNLFSM